MAVWVTSSCSEKGAYNRSETIHNHSVREPLYHLQSAANNVYMLLIERMWLRGTVQYTIVQ